MTNIVVPLSFFYMIIILLGFILGCIILAEAKRLHRKNRFTNHRKYVVPDWAYGFVRDYYETREDWNIKRLLLSAILFMVVMNGTLLACFGANTVVDNNESLRIPVGIILFIMSVVSISIPAYALFIWTIDFVKLTYVECLLSLCRKYPLEAVVIRYPRLKKLRGDDW